MRVALVLASLTLACGEPTPGPAVAPDPAPPEQPVIAPEPEIPAGPLTVGAPVPVEHTFFGVGPLYQGFFRAEGPVAALGAALGTCLGQTAQLLVSYDSAEFVGTIVLKVPPGASACLAREADGALDLAPVVPLTRALAAYRDAISSSYDFRVASFRVGLLFTRGTHSCALWAAGQHPPDGTRFGPCPDLNGVPTCATGSASDGVTALAFPRAADQRHVRECFSR